jgi:hypothetical protein
MGVCSYENPDGNISLDGDILINDEGVRPYLTKIADEYVRGEKNNFPMYQVYIGLFHFCNILITSRIFQDFIEIYNI